MGLRINTNIPSLNAQRNLAEVSRRISGNMRRLATGLRITTAADDPAGFAMSERLRAQIRSMDQGKRNALDGISLVQTAEGALAEVSDMLVRMRELAVQSSNGTVSGQDRDTLQQEFGELLSEIDRIARGTEFNGIQLLDGSSSSISLQIGAGTAAGLDTMSVSLSGILRSDLGLNTVDIGSAGNVSFAMSAVDDAINSISATRGRLGATQNRLGYAINNIGNRIENLSAAESRIRDVDIARETADLARNQIIQQATIAVLAQANSQPQLVLRLLGV